MNINSTRKEYSKSRGFTKRDNNPFKIFKSSKVPKTTLNKGTVMTPLKSITKKNKTNLSKKSNKKMISTSLNLLNHLTIRSQD